MSAYSGGCIINILYSDSQDFYAGGVGICYEYPIDEKTIFELNIYELEEVEDIYIYLQSNYESLGCTIYNVWLEK